MKKQDAKRLGIILSSIQNVKNDVLENWGKQATELSETHEIENPKEAIGQFDTDRKHYPVDTGLFKYFPKALQYISYVSWKGGDKHHPGEPVHWDRSKSQDDADALGRHLLDDGEFDDDGVLFQGKVAWRSLATLEKTLEDKGFKI